jgi:hypothetical protein
VTDPARAGAIDRNDAGYPILLEGMRNPQYCILCRRLPGGGSGDRAETSGEFAGTQKRFPQTPWRIIASCRKASRTPEKCGFRGRGRTGRITPMTRATAAERAAVTHLARSQDKHAEIARAPTACMGERATFVPGRMPWNGRVALGQPVAQTVSKTAVQIRASAPLFAGTVAGVGARVSTIEMTRDADGFPGRVRRRPEDHGPVV